LGNATGSRWEWENKIPKSSKVFEANRTGHCQPSRGVSNTKKRGESLNRKKNLKKAYFQKSGVMNTDGFTGISRQLQGRHWVG